MAMIVRLFSALRLARQRLRSRFTLAYLAVAYPRIRHHGKVSVTRGVTIGDRAVVGANSVVTRSLPRRGVYAGAPAVPIGAGESSQNASKTA